MTRILLSTSFILLSAGSFGQHDSLQLPIDSLNQMVEAPNPTPETWLYRWSGPHFAQKESSVGLVPSLQGVNELFIGIGISKARFVLGEGGGNGYGTTLAFEYNPFEKIIAPKLNFWATGFAYLFGGNLGISAIYYTKNQLSNFVIRPEIGLGYLKLFLNYGYNLCLRDDFEGVSKHTLTLSYYHTFLPFKAKQKTQH